MNRPVSAGIVIMVVCGMAVAWRQRPKRPSEDPPATLDDLFDAQNALRRDPYIEMLLKAHSDASVNGLTRRV